MRLMSAGVNESLVYDNANRLAEILNCRIEWNCAISNMIS
jgi:hypothetical protein